jgi:predicted RNase H-like nuclease (RuvC/YqgF family)
MTTSTECNEVRKLWIVIAAVSVAAAATFDAAVEQSREGQVRERASQKKVEALDDRTQALMQRYGKTIEEQERIRSYNAQLGQMVASQAEEMASLQQQIDTVEATNEELVPMMQQMIATLEQFLSVDSPFLLEERKRRIADLKAAMQSASISISEKYRRIMEAYSIEQEYARTIEAYRGRVALPEGMRTVDLLRVGRVGLYYRSLDGQAAGMWHLEKHEWIPLGDAENRAVRSALLIARKQAAPDIFVLPVMKDGVK